jgi:hypothetical protein
MVIYVRVMETVERGCVGKRGKRQDGKWKSSIAPFPLRGKVSAEQTDEGSTREVVKMGREGLNGVMEIYDSWTFQK